MNKILIVDDEQLICMLMQQALEANGYQVDVAHDGVAGLEKIEEFVPDILIVDLKMPRMSGMDVLKNVKENRPEIEVIMITGHGGIESAIEAMKLGAFGYIEKPIVEFKELELEIVKALNRRELVLRHKVLEERNKKNLALQQTLLDILHIHTVEVGTIERFDKILSILNGVYFLVGQKQCGIFTVEDDPNKLMLKSNVNFPSEIVRRCSTVSFGDCLCGTCAINKETINKEFSCCGECGTNSDIHYVTPIKTANNMYGVLTLCIEKKYPIGREEDDFIQTIASILAGILEHRESEKRLLYAKDVAEKSNKLKSEVLSTVTHELRTPLTSILAFAGTLKMSLENSIFPLLEKISADDEVREEISEMKEDLNIMEIEGDRLINLLNNFLDLTKLESGLLQWKTEVFNLIEIVKKVVNTTKELATKKGITVNSYSDEEELIFKGDKERITQLFTNLIGNAIKFTESGGVIVNVTRGDFVIQCEVSDTGIGIPGDMLDKVFEKFRQVGDILTEKPQGTGLGLPICKEIVEHYGGRIWAESDQNVGTKFVFKLPLANAAP